jgi:hypothetical protein
VADGGGGAQRDATPLPPPFLLIGAGFDRSAPPSNMARLLAEGRVRGDFTLVRPVVVLHLPPFLLVDGAADADDAMRGGGRGGGGGVTTQVGTKRARERPAAGGAGAGGADEVDSSACPVCLDGPTDRAILPCGHRICHECLEALEVPRCPLCRGPIAGSMEV